MSKVPILCRGIRRRSYFDGLMKIPPEICNGRDCTFVAMLERPAPNGDPDCLAVYSIADHAWHAFPAREFIAATCPADPQQSAFDPALGSILALVGTVTEAFLSLGLNAGDTECVCNQTAKHRAVRKAAVAAIPQAKIPLEIEDIAF